MSTYQSKDSQIQGRQLEAQELHLICNVVAATSDLPSNVSIANGTITASVITVNLGEPVAKVFRVSVLDATMEPVAVDAVAISGSSVVVTLDGTGLTSAKIHLVYKIDE